MLKSTARIYELIIYQLSYLVQIVRFAERRIEENKKKFYPTEEDLNPNTRFIENTFIRRLEENEDFKRKLRAYKINWADEQETIRRSFQAIREMPAYQKYMSAPASDFENDKSIILKIFRDHVAENESLAYFYEEKNAYWANDLFIVNMLVVKIIKNFSPKIPVTAELPPLFNVAGKEDPDEDKDFLTRLYRKTILKSSDLEEIIQEKASNWEFNRIAMMDTILLKMAITELMEFPSIPVKVTLNEYIELSKSYSTPKSRIFINGILDKIITEMKADNRIRKSGRGLIE